MISKLSLFILVVVALYVASVYMVVTGSLRLKAKEEDAVAITNVALGGVCFTLALICTIVAAKHPINFMVGWNV